ncbi:hypothetical protein MSAN_00109100 [Mycena sanguinolenta]|uniref:P-loop containing nucleoside triphosphate hydrolase protein n=1 Tax=Mycena sanguinolenta TaxID=230812 RepID=A0A8H6ZDF3_9AGAR|nr:hypothetical protein MSAN_00109100 [Mycena sanguinolenta]
MDALRSLVQPLVNGSSVIDGMKLVVIGGTVETARRMSSSAWSHFVNSFFLTAHFSEEDHPYDWLMLWLSRRPEWQRSREFETTTRAAHAAQAQGWEDDPELAIHHEMEGEEGVGPSKTRVIFQPTFDTTHTIYWRGHWLRVRRGRGADGGEVLSVSVVARSNTILKALVLQAKKEYEAEAVHRIQIFFADPHGSWRWADARHKRPMGSIVLDPGVKEMLLGDARDFLASEKWYADRGIPFRRGYLLHGVPGSGKSSLIHAIAGELMLDIYVVSLSSAWISDSVLMSLMGRVPKGLGEEEEARWGAILLLEDLDAAFTRSTSRTENDGPPVEGPDLPPKRRSRDKEFRDRDRDGLSDLNTLSLSGLLNALDGVAAAEGRILFATTNHLEKLDPALSRPGRMDVWVEFKNASKWQAEALFRNFFPSTDEDDLPLDDGELDLPGTPDRLGPLRVLALSVDVVALVHQHAHVFHWVHGQLQRKWKCSREEGSEGEGTGTTAPAVWELEQGHSARPLDGKTLANLAKSFADSIPDGEFSVAALQGYLLKNKSRPEAAATEAAAWVVAEREMRERLKKEKEARESKEKAEREKKRKAAAEKKEAETKAKKEKEDAEKAKADAAAAPAVAAPAVVASITDAPLPSATNTAEAAPIATATEPPVAVTGDAPAQPAAPVPVPVTEAAPMVPPAPATPAPEPPAPVIVPDSDSESSESEYEDDVDRSRPIRRISPWTPVRPAHSQWASHPPPPNNGWGASWL